MDMIRKFFNLLGRTIKLLIGRLCASILLKITKENPSCY